jgi:hypothetical protein
MVLTVDVATCESTLSAVVLVVVLTMEAALFVTGLPEAVSSRIRL